jgi:uncharacterized protein Yka (UPF0111/DUF47 family)
LFKLAQDPSEWTNSLPQAIRIPKSDNSHLIDVFDDIAKKSKRFMKTLPSRSKKDAGSPEPITLSSELEAYGRLPATMDLIETLVENDNRLTMYEAEVDVINRSGMSFQEWQQLTPLPSPQENGGDLMYITIS